MYTSRSISAKFQIFGGEFRAWLTVAVGAALLEEEELGGLAGKESADITVDVLLLDSLRRAVAVVVCLD
jgi:hypothetical protein